MKDVINEIDSWLADGETAVALATVVQTWGSAPRRAGAKMALTPNGRLCGSVSGGCVEGAVFDAGTAVLHSGQGQLLHFGVADETAWEVGLACGGTIEIFVEPLDAQVYAFWRDLLTQDKAGASVTIVRGPAELVGRKLTFARDGQQLGTLGTAELDAQARTLGNSLKGPARQTWGDLDLFIEVFRPVPTLIMVGGVHIAVALTSLARVLNYHTVVIDPRRAFGSAERFPHVDRLLTLWPDKALAELALTPETAVALLTHDPKIDDPALKLLLPSPVFYIGALGSQKTHAKRQERLRQMGFSPAAIDRIHAPIGLKLGAQTPEEIALSILAEIVQTQRH